MNQVLPIWARPGGGVVRGDGGDWSHWQRPLGGRHGEGAHHGVRTRPPPFICCRLTPQRNRKTGKQKHSKKIQLKDSLRLLYGFRYLECIQKYCAKPSHASCSRTVAPVTSLISTWIDWGHAEAEDGWAVNYDRLRFLSIKQTLPSKYFSLSFDIS